MHRGTRQAGEDADLEWSAWMAAAQGGDRLAYERLLKACVPLLRRVARREGVPADRVDDVVQDVLLTVHRARQTYDPARSFTAWVCTITQRRAIDALRRHGRQGGREVQADVVYESFPDPEDDPGQAWERASRAEILRQEVAKLPPGQREAVDRLAVDQLSLEEASALTGKTKGALKVNLHRALKALRGRIGTGG
jgi:RNA polymerase sigma factor (sigma-70 family)